MIPQNLVSHTEKKMRLISSIYWW